MDVTNATWQLVGDAAPDSLVVQNVGTCRIAFVFAASQPGASDIALDSHEHFTLAPGSDPYTVTDLATYTRNMYVRALGPINGKLAVESNSAA